MLKKVLSNKKCAKCKICCTFDYSDQWETPLFDKEEADRLNNRGIKTKKVNNLYTFDIPFEDDGKILLCPVLDSEKGCTLSSDEKPYDCKIWPLRPMRKDDKIIITLSPVCPNFLDDSKNIEELVKDGLGAEILEVAQKNPDIVKDYIEGYKIIYGC